MSSIRSASPTKSESSFRSPSPSKAEDLKPNAHPYAIRTTSTALLSRSNSSTKNQVSPHHHYVPQTPPSTSPGPKRHHGNGHHRHRYSSSLSSDNLPRPLPVPPSPSSETTTQDGFFPKRSGTSPVPASSILSTAPLTLEDLPPNPKLWTPSQLCAYLATALRVKSGETMQLPPQVARDIASFVRDSKINGKNFLRLDDADLEAYGVNQLWKSALLQASRNLRQNVLKGRIWGFGNEVENGVDFPSTLGDTVHEHIDEEDDDDATPHRRRRSASQPQTTRSKFAAVNHRDTIIAHPFPNGLPVYSSASSSSSTEDLFSPVGNSPMISFSADRFSTGTSSPNGTHSKHRHHGRSRNGRVKGMVDTFERSSSFDDNDPTSAKLLQEIKGMRASDMEELRRLRRERSGSISSASSGYGSSHSPSSPDAQFGAFDTVASPIEDSSSDGAYNVSTITSSRPLPTPPDSGNDATLLSGEEEPSIEALLAAEGVTDAYSNIYDTATTAFRSKAASGRSLGSFSISKGKGKAKKRGGVYAWEAEADDFDAASPGKATAKRVPSQVPAPPSLMNSISSAKDIFGDSEKVGGPIREESTGSNGSGEGHASPPIVIMSSGGGSGTHTPSRPLPEPPLHPTLIPLPTFEDASVEPSSAAEEDTESLRASIADTSILLRAFEARLGEVERKVDVLEVEVSELEVASAARAAREKEQALVLEKEQKEEEKGNDGAFLNEWPIVRKLLTGFFGFGSSAPAEPSSSSARSRSLESRPRRSDSTHLDPQTLSQLPPFVLLVGLGVCVVVLKVVAKRLSGKR